MYMNRYYANRLLCKKAACLFPWLLLFHLKSFAALTCPPNQTLTTAPFACEAQLDFSGLSWSSSAPLTDTIFTPGPGHDFPIGVTPVTLTVTEVGGNMASCTFQVTVLMFSNNTMSCKDNVTIHLDASCTKVITAADMLNGQYGCDSYYLAQFASPPVGVVPAVATADHIGQTQTVKVTNTLSGFSCWGTITVSTSSFPFSITCPPDTVVGCNHPLDPDALGHASFTTCIDSSKVQVIYLNNMTLLGCSSNNTIQILRTWRATDIYGNERACVQSIAAQRGTLDQVIFPTNLVYTCEQVGQDPSLTSPDAAGEPLLYGRKIGHAQCDMSLEFTDTILQVCGASYTILREWAVVDWCVTEVRFQVQTIEVLDENPPVVSLVDTVFVSTNPVCGLDALFPAATITDCSDTEVLITTPWGTVASNGGYAAVNPMPGTPPASYTVTDACSNVTLEPLAIQVQNGIIVTCPPDTTITCDYFEANLAAALAIGDSSVLEVLGLPAFYANCQLTRTHSHDLNLNSCGAGTLVRTMGATEVSDHCVQHIEVAQVSDFVVQFPADLTVMCGEAPFDGGVPTVSGVSCEEVQVSYTDVQVQSQGTDACFRIMRTWVVQNTCIANPSNPIAEQAESQLGSTPCDLDGDGDCDSRTYRDGGDGYIVHEQVIRIQDIVDPVFVNGCSIPDVCTDSASCTGAILLPTQEVLECATYNLTVELNIGGVWLNIFGPYMNVQRGTYNVRYMAKDNCNNQTQCLTTVKVVDCEPPVAVCKSGIVIELFQTGMATLWASDFDNGSHDNCPGNLKFSFSQNINDIGKDVNCEDLGQNTFELWVTDNAGNQSSCTFFVIIQEPWGQCEPTDIAGTVATETFVGVSGVSVSASTAITVTDASGYYYLGGFYTTPSTVITALHDIYPLNGVSTFDIVLIRQHILHINLLDSPYKIIAADANRSNTVTTFDLVIISKLILGDLPNFPNNTSWRFVPKVHVFPNPANPFNFPFPETINIGPGNSPLSLDFVAIKVGDVNGSASPNFNGEEDEGLVRPPASKNGY